MCESCTASANATPFRMCRGFGGFGSGSTGSAFPRSSPTMARWAVGCPRCCRDGSPGSMSGSAEDCAIFAPRRAERGPRRLLHWTRKAPSRSGTHAMWRCWRISTRAGIRAAGGWSCGERARRNTGGGIRVAGSWSCGERVGARRNTSGGIRAAGSWSCGDCCQPIPPRVWCGRDFQLLVVIAGHTALAAELAAGVVVKR